MSMSFAKDQGVVAPRCGKIIERDDAAIWQDVNRAPFLFKHHLALHPLYDLPHLARMAKLAVQRGDPFKFGFRVKELNPKFENASYSERLLLATAMVADGAAAHFKISNLEELDPAYRELLDKMIEEVEELSGMSLRDDILLSGSTAFVASGSMVTPYHFDNDTNFLVQIRGEKQVRLFDGNNRQVVPEAEIEDYYSGQPMAGVYRDELLQWSTVYELTPGLAVHHPPLAPHLISTGESVSVSASLWFTLGAQVDRARIYQANYCLRRLGLRPLPPGQSHFRDRLKIMAFNALAKKILSLSTTSSFPA